jgi:hypothetical protein
MVEEADYLEPVDHSSEDITNYDFREKQEDLAAIMLEKYSIMIENEVSNLIRYLRSLEKVKYGSGIEELEKLYKDDVLSLEMVNSILPAVQDLSKDFKVNILNK